MVDGKPVQVAETTVNTRPGTQPDPVTVDRLRAQAAQVNPTSPSDDELRDAFGPGPKVTDHQIARARQLVEWDADTLHGGNETVALRRLSRYEGPNQPTPGHFAEVLDTIGQTIEGSHAHDVTIHPTYRRDNTVYGWTSTITDTASGENVDTRYHLNDEITDWVGEDLHTGLRGVVQAAEIIDALHREQVVDCQVRGALSGTGPASGFENAVNTADAPVTKWAQPSQVYGCNCGCVFIPSEDGETTYADRYEMPGGCDNASCECHDIP